jgi:hypothetical protein
MIWQQTAHEYQVKKQQYKYDLMMLTIATRENIIRGHAQMAIDLKQKFSLFDSSNQRSTTKELMKSIEDRKNVLKQ